MDLDNMKKLFVHELKDLHDAEQQILEALPKMAERARHQELKAAFEEHRQQTEGHVRRLERIFDDLGERPGGVTCKGIRGIIAESEEEILDDNADDDVRDAAMIAAAQRVEHYEMAAYGSARTYALMMDQAEHAELLQQTLDEEGETDHKLTDLAMKKVNPDAMK